MSVEAVEGFRVNDLEMFCSHVLRYFKLFAKIANNRRKFRRHHARISRHQSLRANRKADDALIESVFVVRTQRQQFLEMNIREATRWNNELGNSQPNQYFELNSSVNQH